jgi:hypothetical protein
MLEAMAVGSKYFNRQITPMLHHLCLLLACHTTLYYLPAYYTTLSIYSHAIPLLEAIQNLNPDIGGLATCS